MMRYAIGWIFCLFYICVLGLGCGSVDTGPAGAPARARASGAAAAAGEEAASPGAPSDVEQPSPPPLAAGSEAGVAGVYVGEDLDALLAKAASTELGRAVHVQTTYKRQLDHWRFVVGAPRELNGEPVDYGSTRLADQAAAGLVDDVFMALAQRSEGQWRLLAYSLGATDAPFFDWSERFGVPLSLFSE
jgi:hypothetical protein